MIDPARLQLARQAVDSYLRRFQDGTPAGDCIETMVHGYVVDDGAVSFVAPGCAGERVTSLRAGLEASGLRLSDWSTTATASDGCLAVVTARLQWSGPTGDRVQTVDYVVRPDLHPHIIAIAT